MVEATELHALAAALTNHGFETVGFKTVKLGDGTKAPEGRLRYEDDELALRLYKQPPNNNGDHNWYKWRRLFTGNKFRLLSPRGLNDWFHVTPNLYRRLDTDHQGLLLLAALSPRVMHLIYSQDDIERLRVPLQEFGQRQVSVDESRSEIRFEQGKMRIEHHLHRSKRNGLACSLEIDINGESNAAYRKGILPLHILQQQERHYCLPSKQFPILPLDFDKIDKGFEVYVHNDDTFSGYSLDEQRFAELFAGMPLPTRFLIWFRQKQYTPVVGVKGGIHLSSRLFRADNYERTAGELATSMEPFKLLYDSSRSLEPSAV